ncbi:hypothetical protein DV515_00019265, partial [Chloebia gouldiae]
ALPRQVRGGSFINSSPKNSHLIGVHWGSSSTGEWGKFGSFTSKKFRFSRYPLGLFLDRSVGKSVHSCPKKSILIGSRWGSSSTGERGNSVHLHPKNSHLIGVHRGSSST